MLKDLFSLVTIVALLFSSCSKSDEEENSDEPQPTKQTAYFGVNLSGAEFGNVYPGVDGTHYGYPTEKDLDYFKAKGLHKIINMQSLVMHDALLTISVTYGRNWQKSLKTIKISGVTTS